ncbi:MAG: methionyl-tRNA formyltransferase [Halanaerobiales bacterium]|nr:methionyl-tRNA formyltransferase [Halanaerobiales bacterium]
MDIIFMGTPDFAVPSLEQLHKSKEIEVKAVVTQPDRPRGRGQKLQPSPVKRKALKLGLKVFQEKDVNQVEFIEELKRLNPDAVVVVAFGQKLGRELLNLTRFGCINLHASLLPEYRGASPIHQAIIDGRNESGVTTMFMDEGWDTGDIIYQKKVEIKRTDTVGTLHDRLAVVGAELLVKTILDIEKGIAPRIKQDEGLATYASKIDKEIGRINWNNTAEDIFNLVRGVNPWPGAFTTHRGKLLKVWWVIPLKVTKAENAEPGEIVATGEEEGLVVKTGQGLVKIEKLQLAGRRKMSVKDFLRGYNIEKGEKFI